MLLLQDPPLVGVCPHLPLVGARDPRLAGGELPDPSESPMSFSGCGQSRLLFLVICGLLIVLASLVWTTGSRQVGFSTFLVFS